MLLSGAVAVLTGSGRVNGVGAATAELLAKQGCHVLINCIKNEQQAQQVVKKCAEFDVDAELFIGDVSNSAVCHEMANFVKNKWGRADIVVNCVGTTKGASYERLDQLTESDFSKMFLVNATAPFLVAQAFQSLLKQSGDGVIVNISSAAGITGKGSSIAYAAAKGAENTLTLALSQALSPEVRVNAVCPSFIDSSWWEESYKDKQDKYDALVNSMKESNLLNRVLKPADVAQTILSIIHNPVMTGELIRLNAGAHVGKANPR
ncbi:MAG: oxidoreductase [Gammaproteobacteria bacterium CG_4_10_14_0_8_um_filter_38_16]|nr:MAG: oxidoreductase [Gammaproteobacteria bacterium CG_4_10_14_0_8_um_filter_38_16]PJA04281.1 MAG: oxidoreductase [Gammaproteobacteria bacterium CG_4_10_14_0_2_um_filter_38_22]PJB11572.1 MAG: oxidoreductase [Gammaproteobacteria bacterium CG_4_9_14_3_um_filter_38_9]